MENTHTSGSWYYNIAGQIYSENDGKDIALLRNGNEADAYLIAAAPDMLAALIRAEADLTGLLPEFEPSGDRVHPAWQTLREIRDAIAKAVQS